MAPTSRATKTDIENLLSYLLESEIALFTNPVVDSGGRVTWRSLNRNGTLLPRPGESTLLEYRFWLESEAYSAILADGSLLQITYDFVANVLVGHRLAYVPCPFVMDPQLLREESPVDLLDLYAAGKPRDVLLRSTLRFDFDATAATGGHPASHFTVNMRDCRVPCAAPLSLGHFVAFIFEHFYPRLWHLHPYLNGVSRTALSPRTVTEAETERVHVTWPT